MFVSDNQEIHNLSEFLELCSTKEVAFEKIQITDKITRLKIPNKELHKLSYGVKYGKKGEYKLYYLNESHLIIVKNGYGFSGVGEPHKRYTRAETFTEIHKPFVSNELNNSKIYSGKTAREMETLIKNYYKKRLRIGTCQ